MSKEMTIERLSRRLRKADDRAEMRDTETHTRLDEVQQSVNAVSKAIGNKGAGGLAGLVELLPGQETVISTLRTVRGQGTESLGMLKAMGKDLSLAVGTSKSIAGALATATEQTWERLDALTEAVKHRQDNLESRTLNELRDLKRAFTDEHTPKRVSESLAALLPEMQGLASNLAKMRVDFDKRADFANLHSRLRAVRDSQTRQEVMLEALAKALLPDDADERSYRMILSDLSAVLASIRPNAARAAENTSAILQHVQEQSSGVGVASFETEITLEDGDLTTLLAELDSSLRAVIEGQSLVVREHTSGYGELVLSRISELRQEMHGLDSSDLLARQQDHLRIGEIARQLDKLTKALTEDGPLADNTRQTNGNVLALRAGLGDLMRLTDDAKQVAMQTRSRVDQGRSQLTDLVSMLSAHYQSHSSSIGQVRSRAEAILERQEKTDQRIEALYNIVVMLSQHQERLEQRNEDSYQGLTKHLTEVERKVSETLDGLESGKYQQAL